jgi:hypothetical protein
MEFLTKEEKRKHATRLFLGYGLVAILIGLATTLLVYMAQGYNYDSNNGVVRGGLIFVESQPVSANIYIDEQIKDRTSARISLGEGQHNLALRQDKYRDWSKTFNLEGGTVLYFIYPKLIPTDITVGVTKVFDGVPVWASQSPNQRWLVLQQNATSPVLTIIDLDNPTNEPALSTLPAGQLVGRGSQLGALTPIEWADDNQHLLLRQNLDGGGSSYVIFDRDNSDNSVNITARHNLPITGQITLKNQKYDKYYFYEPTSQNLSLLDLQTGLVPTPLLQGVVAFKAFADDLLLYVTYTNALSAQADVYVLSSQQDTYKLKSITRDIQQRYLLDLAQFDHSWYYITASVQDNMVLLYRNPLKRATAGNIEPINPQMSLELINPQSVSFSKNYRFVSMQSDKNFVIFDAEQNKVFKFSSSLNISPGQQAQWMDGYRLMAVTDGMVNIFDFDGTNIQPLVASQPGFTGYFDKDYRYIYTFMPQADGKTAFATGQLFVQ